MLICFHCSNFTSRSEANVNTSTNEVLDRLTLSKHAPLKSAIIRGRNKPHTRKQSRKEIMIRTKLKNKASRTKAEKDHKQCRKQRNLVFKLNKRVKVPITTGWTR